MLSHDAVWAARRAAGKTGRPASAPVHSATRYPHAIEKTGRLTSGFTHCRNEQAPRILVGPGGLVHVSRKRSVRPPPVPQGKRRSLSNQAGARRWQTISTRNTKSVKTARSRAGGAIRRGAEIVFPNRIAELRANATPILSQRNLSVTLGISERQLRRIERGSAVPNARLLWRIAKALAVTAADLYLKRGDGRM